MSAIVQTLTPFLEQDVLLAALEDLNIGYEIQGSNIIIERADYFGKQKFIWENHKYVFRHDADNTQRGNTQNFKSTNDFLKKLEDIYKLQYAKKMEQLAAEEQARLEALRIAYVAQQTTAIKAKAKEMGYDVVEKKVDNKIRLVLVKNTY
jgi:uncharacterized protein YnzC (UPF0291/DUF896 family)